MIVYIATNKQNNKVYVGKTSQTLSQRKAEHFSKARKGFKTYFYDAMRKYGFDSFEWQIIVDKIDNEQDLNRAEIDSIAFYKSNCKDSGYNLTNGGEGTLGLKPMLGKKHSELSKNRMSKARIGKKPWNRDLRQVYSQKSLSKMSESAKNRSAFSNEKIAISRGSRKFLVLEKSTNKLVGIWINKAECEKTLGLSRSSISTCLSGNQKSSGGYVFRYVGV